MPMHMPGAHAVRLGTAQHVGAPRLCPNLGRLSLGDEVAEAEVTRYAVPELRRDLPRHGPVERDGDALDLQRGPE